METKTNQIAENEEADVREVNVAPKYDCIKLGIDWHAAHYRVVRMIDNAGPEPAQRFTPAQFLIWAKKQRQLAKEVHSCYEAGCGGFVLHRQLVPFGITSHVVAPCKLDRDNRGVQTDATDARELADNLDRYVRGNLKAMRPVFIPTVEQEQRRHQSRQRQALQKHRLSLAAQGRSVMLLEGRRESNNWWKPQRWEQLKKELPGWLIEMLEVYRKLIVAIDEQVTLLLRAIEKAAPEYRPKGLGALSYESILREVGDFKRFKNRKAPGSYTGLTGGVSATGDSHHDLSITKAGNRRLRTMLIEAAWRFVTHQPDCKLVQRWRAVLLNQKAHRRTRKRAIVAVARQLFVDLWRWQTGRTTPEKLGWIMVGTPAT